MPTKRGCWGKVKSGSTPDLVGEVRTWSFEETAEVLDASSIGDCTKSWEVGAVATSGQVQCWWDPADTGQDNFTIGTEIGLYLYPEGDSAGDVYYYTTTAIITSIAKSGGVDGIVEANFSFQVNGSLTEATV